ncbi:hypothetical protein HDU67_008068 [Dinochytrium kinnereticum]|nr:hypothetical protein HDU67_008068 [Dinochytrium kinnereticum]
MSTIVHSGALEPEPFRPKASKNNDEEKKRLQWLMESNGSKLEDQPDPCEKPKPSRAKNEELDEFKMVFEEIQDRRQWLDDMIALGHGEQYKRQIQSEIALRLRRLEDIDKERTRKERIQFPTMTPGVLKTVDGGVSVKPASVNPGKAVMDAAERLGTVAASAE